MLKLIPYLTIFFVSFMVSTIIGLKIICRFLGLKERTFSFSEMYFKKLFQR